MTKWQRSQDWVGTQVEDQYVMIHLESGRYVALNESAWEAWEALEEPRTAEAVLEALQQRFDVDTETGARSVDTLLERMQSMELVQKAA